MRVVEIVAASLFILALTPLNLVAQEPEQDLADNIDVLADELDGDLRALRVLVNQTQKADTTDRQALTFRQDDRSFRLLEDADALAAALAELPAGDPNRQEAQTKLAAVLKGTSEAVFKRLDELNLHIEENTVQLDSLSAGARIFTEAYLQVLEGLRFQYYEALISHYVSRESLGLPLAESKQKLTRLLYLHAEALTGKIEFSNATLQDVQSRFDSDPGNADLALAVTNLSVRHAESIEGLSMAIDQLNRLEIDTSDYTAVLLQHRGGVSVGLFQSGVVDQLFAGWFEGAKDAVVESAPDLLLQLIIFLLVLFVFRALSRLTRRVVRASCDRSSLDLSVLLKDILVSASGGTVMILGVLMALSQIGISLGPMLAGLGVAGFVIGFALQDTLGNFAAGAMILIYRPYDVDDFVEVTGASGLVKNMNLVSTTIVTFDNQTLVIPNSKIWGDVIKNVTAQKVRRVDLEFGIGYSDDIEKTERVLADILDSHEMILETPKPMIKLHTLGDSSVNFVVRPWTKTEDYWDVYWDITREVKMRFDAEGISIPFPQRDVHLYNQGSA